jgi:hypothetical protein
MNDHAPRADWIATFPRLAMEHSGFAAFITIS